MERRVLDVDDDDDESLVEVSVPDVVVGSPGLMSVVTGGLVLVIVSGVVVPPDVLLPLLLLSEPLGSTKY